MSRSGERAGFDACASGRWVARPHRLPCGRSTWHAIPKTGRFGASPSTSLRLPRPRWEMLRKAILVTVILALATAQALAVNCDLRCSLTGIGSLHCGQHAGMATGHKEAEHCHGMSVQAVNSFAAVSGEHSCGATFCKNGLFAIEKGSAVRGVNFPSSQLALSPLSALTGQAANNARCSNRRRMPRQLARIPLEMRPGTSLRI
jgi:hypothetical protein